MTRNIKARELIDWLGFLPPHRNLTIDGEERALLAAELRRLDAANANLLEALQDMHDGWKYIRRTHGDLYGVGWDRAENKAIAAIAKATGTADE